MSSGVASSSLDYHTWFEPAMYHWIRIAEFKARARTGRAVELDSWSRMDDRVYHSMSAVNTTDIFNNVRQQDSSSAYNIRLFTVTTILSFPTRLLSSGETLTGRIPRELL